MNMPPRLLLGTPVKYAGLQATIIGRTFGAAELYDLQWREGRITTQFLGIGRSQLEVDWTRLREQH